MEYDHDEFYNAVVELAKIDGVESVLSIPGVAEIVIEHYNNAAIERLDKEREAAKEQQAYHEAAVTWHLPKYDHEVGALFHRRVSDTEYLAVVKRRGSTKPWKLFRAGEYKASFTTASRAMAAGDRLDELLTGSGVAPKTFAQYEDEISILIKHWRSTHNVVESRADEA